MSPLFFLLAALPAILCFNLDVPNAMIFVSPRGFNLERGSYFGYSLALYTTHKLDDSMLLVGAPRANSTRIGDSRYRVVEPGAVYRCPLNRSSGCYEWLLDDSRDNKIFNNTYYQQSRDHAWLGAVVSVENSPSPMVAVCAPRWKKKLLSQDTYSLYVNGMCYTAWAKDSSAFSHANTSRRLPLDDPNHQYFEFVPKKFIYDFGMGMAGFSAHFAPEEHELVLGAPGVYHWTGAVMKLTDKHKRVDFDALIPKVIKDSNLKYEDYFGYAMTSGGYHEENVRLFAGGAPRGSEMLGKVFIFSFPQRDEQKLLYHNIIEGEQFGEYFGSSLASCDINNDGRDDLVIGAPQWTKESDEGRIYVYTFSFKKRVEVLQRLEGSAPGARFGTSLACLGDLDQDGHADVAVGAPYEDERGAVYVYNGGPEGLDARRPQIIRAAEVSPALRGFGISISEPRDVDGNGWADLAVGAYLSGHAVLFKGRPVVNLNVNIERPCNFTLAQNSTDFLVEVCAVYYGASAPDTFAINHTLVIDESLNRVIVYQNGRLFGNIFRTTTVLDKGIRQCIVVKVYLKKNNQNFLDSIEIVESVTGSTNHSCPYCPIINPRLSRTSEKLKLAYAIECGKDNVCISDLHVNATSELGPNNTYIVGSRSEVNVIIFVENTNEPAYRTQLYIHIPQPIALARIPPECTMQDQNSTTEVVCSIGNPLRYAKNLTLALDMSKIHFTDEFDEIKISVTSQSLERNYSDNNISLKINYDVDADLAIAGKSFEELYSYAEKDVSDKNFTKFKFNHIYEVYKFGTTPIDEAVLVVNVPTNWNNIEIARISVIQGSLDGKPFICENISNEDVSEYKKNMNLSLLAVDKKYFHGANNSFVIPPENRTFYMNCSNVEITCKKFLCKLEHLLKSQSMAQLSVTIDLQLFQITEKMEKKDIIFFVSEGFVNITRPNVSIEFANKRPDYKLIATLFLRRPKPEEVAIWIIIVSVLLGIILLIFITFLLFKQGFFNRKEKEDLDALISKENNPKDSSADENANGTIEEETAEEIQM